MLEESSTSFLEFESFQKKSPGFVKNLVHMNISDYVKQDDEKVLVENVHADMVIISFLEIFEYF